MRPMLLMMRDDPDFELHIQACDMHTKEEFGYTRKEIQEDFQYTALVTPECDRPTELGYIASGVAQYLGYIEPDLLMLYGDRGESLAAAMVAVEMCIPIAHLQGGDRSGTMDDRRRYAISALADLHFVSTEQAAIQVTKIAPSTEHIYVTGDSHLDPIFLKDYAHTPEVYAHLNLETDKPVLIVLHHPDPTDSFSGHEYIHRIMDAIDDIERQIVMIYPCSDPGWEHVVRAIEWFREHENIQIHRNLPSRIFLGLMDVADCIIGNSSAGIIEAPYLDLPCVNVGHRQDGRLQSGNVVNVGYDVLEIEAAMIEATHKRPPFNKLYGSGATGLRIINHLKEWKR